MSNKLVEYLTIASVVVGLPLISSISGVIPVIGGLIQFLCFTLENILMFLGASLVYHWCIKNYDVIHTKAIELYEKAKTLFA